MHKFPKLRWCLFAVKACTILPIFFTTYQSIEVSLNLKINDFRTVFHLQTTSDKLFFPHQKEVRLNFQADTSNAQLDWNLTLGSKSIPAKIYPSCYRHEDYYIAVLATNNAQFNNS